MHMHCTLILKNWDFPYVGNLIKISTCQKQNKQRKHTPKKTITRTRQHLRGSTICLRPRSCRDFIIKQGDTIVHKNTLKKPNSQYTLTLSHPQYKKILYFFLCDYCQVLGILSHTRLQLNLKPNIYIYIYIYVKVGYTRNYIPS